MAYAVGLMSGTSLDGIDTALVEISGVNLDTKVSLIQFKTFDLPTATLNRIKQATNKEQSNVELICSLNFELAELYAQAVIDICKLENIETSDLAFVASHGQTIYHIPTPAIGSHLLKSTLQIGEPAVIAEKTKTTVVSNFREKDIAAGGQGAPIVPFSEYILYRDDYKLRLLQNIGGIANVTVIKQQAKLEDLIAFDTGPGNMIIDELCNIFYQQAYDKDGYYASLGQVNPKILADLMQHSYVNKAYPKTTGREEFGVDFTHQLLAKYQKNTANLSANDFIATATMFTAKSIALNITPFITNQTNTELIVSGGGSYNRTLLKFIKLCLPEVKVVTQEDLGYSSEAKEAIAMAILANQTLQHQTANVPSATGANKAVILGKITY